MLRSSRGLAAALVCASCIWLDTTEAVAALVQPPPTTPPDRRDAPVRVQWDPSLNNDFGWRVAGDRIPTACNDVRARFPAKVAMMGCARGDDGAGGPRRVQAFFGGGRADGPARSRTGAPRNRTPAVVTTPLPGSALFLATALGGLAIGRTSRTRRLAKRSARA